MVVVGGGPAGVMAALAADRAGAEVVLLERGAALGGTAIESNGTVWIPNNRLERAAGRSENRDDMLRYMARVGWPERYDPDDRFLGLRSDDHGRIAAFFDHASEMLDWLVDDVRAFDVIWRPDWRGQPMPDYHTAAVGPVPERGRSLSIDMRAEPERAMTWTGGGGGRDLMTGILRVLDRSAVGCVTRCHVTDLAFAGPDRVGGVVAEIGGRTITVAARRGVVFASGGYARNGDLVRRLLGTRLWGDYGISRNTGDVIGIAERRGLALRSLDKTYGGLTAVERAHSDAGNPRLPKTMRPPRGVEHGDSMIMVDRTGRRFVDEKAPYGRKLSHLVPEADGVLQRRLTFQIYDDRSARLYDMAGPQPHIITAPTLPELVEQLAQRLAAIPDTVTLAPDFLAELTRTIQRFNGYAEAGTDQEFQRGASAEDLAFHMGPLWGRYFFRLKRRGHASPPRAYEDVLADFEREHAKQVGSATPNPTMYPIAAEGPYYAIILGAQSVDTAGGLAVTPAGQVRSTDDTPVTGLYAAGSCAAAIADGAYFGGGMAISSALTGGWIAGAAAAEAPQLLRDASEPEGKPTAAEEAS